MPVKLRDIHTGPNEDYFACFAEGRQRRELRPQSASAEVYPRLWDVLKNQGWN